MEEFFSPLFFSCGGVEVGRAGDGSFVRTMQVHILIHTYKKIEEKLGSGEKGFSNVNKQHSYKPDAQVAQKMAQQKCYPILYTRMSLKLFLSARNFRMTNLSTKSNVKIDFTIFEAI